MRIEFAFALIAMKEQEKNQTPLCQNFNPFLPVCSFAFIRALHFLFVASVYFFIFHRIRHTHTHTHTKLTSISTKGNMDKTIYREFRFLSLSPYPLSSLLSLCFTCSSSRRPSLSARMANFHIIIDRCTVQVLVHFGLLHIS